MRDPNRIPRMLQLLGQIWQVAPDLRLGQLVANVHPSTTNAMSDLYFVDDDKMEQELKAFLDRIQRRM